MERRLSDFIVVGLGGLLGLAAVALIGLFCDCFVRIFCSFISCQTPLS